MHDLGCLLVLRPITIFYFTWQESATETFGNGEASAVVSQQALNRLFRVILPVPPPWDQPFTGQSANLSRRQTEHFCQFSLSHAALPMKSFSLGESCAARHPHAGL